MIDTLSLALNGLMFPTFNVATDGFSFEVIPVTPSNHGSGGSTGSGNIAVSYVPYPLERKVVVKIFYNGEEWIDEYEAPETNLFIQDSENIIATFLGLKPITPVTARATFIKSMINNRNTIIKVRKL